MLLFTKEKHKAAVNMPFIISAFIVRYLASNLRQLAFKCLYTVPTCLINSSIKQIRAELFKEVNKPQTKTDKTK